VSPVQRSTV